MNKSDEIGELAKALNAAQKELGPALKDAANPFFKSKYADLTSVWRAAIEPMGNHGLSVSQVSRVAEPYYLSHADGKTEIMLGIIMETVLMHESGQWISGEAFAPLSKFDPQGVGSATTYLRRYGLAAILGIVADDDDGNASSGNAPKGNAAKPKSDPPKNNAPMEKALDAAKDPAKEVEEIWGHGAAHAKQDEILNICRELGAAGDASLTGHKKLADYVLERFDEPLSKLSVKSVGILIEELTERLAERKAMSEESSGDGTPTHSGPSPISPQQLTTLEKVCDLKNYKHEDCALEYSEGEVNTLEGLTEQQAAEAIKKVQKMAKIEVAK